MADCDHCGRELVPALLPGAKAPVPACATCQRLQLPCTSPIYVPAAAPKEPVQCRECPRIEDAAAWSKEAADDIRAQQLCFYCVIWTYHAERAYDPRSVRVRGQHFHISPDIPDRQRGMRGFGGSKFLIEFFDGIRVVSRNLWAQGVVPKHFRSRLPDNARFLIPCNWCNREAQGELFFEFRGRWEMPIPHCGGVSCLRKRGGGRMQFRANTPAGQWYTWWDPTAAEKRRWRRRLHRGRHTRNWFRAVDQSGKLWHRRAPVSTIRPVHPPWSRDRSCPWCEEYHPTGVPARLLQEGHPQPDDVGVPTLQDGRPLPWWKDAS